MRKQQVKDRVTLIRAMPEFNIPNWWLTFYLTASRENLEAAADRLLALHAVNFDGADSGFLYPKLPVGADPNAVLDLIEHVEQISESCAVEIIQVDADTHSDVTLSKCQEIISY
jgi:hypothetical protein